MKRIQQQTLDQERALYGMKDIEVVDCAFDGPADGESALKEGAGIKVAISTCAIRSGTTMGW